MADILVLDGPCMARLRLPEDFGREDVVDRAHREPPPLAPEGR